jgi:hypothetical protein
MHLQSTLSVLALPASDPLAGLRRALEDSAEILDLARVGLVLRGPTREALIHNWSGERLSAAVQVSNLEYGSRRPGSLAGRLRMVARRLYDLLGGLEGDLSAPGGRVERRTFVVAEAAEVAPLATLEISFGSGTDPRIVRTLDLI